MAVSKEQIFTAADQLAADGQRPTLDAVRKITGGSYSTISPILNEWKAKQKADSQPIQEPAPDAISDRLNAVGAEVWATALELANSRLAAEREALDALRIEQEAAQAEAIELADQLADEITDLKASCEKYRKEAAEEKSTANELRLELATALEQTKIAEARAVELRTEVDRAHANEDRLRIERDKALDQADQRAKDADRAAQALRQELAAALEQTKIAEARGAELATEVVRAHEGESLMRIELDKAQDQAEKLALKIEELQAERASAVMGATAQQEKQALELNRLQQSIAELVSAQK